MLRDWKTHRDFQRGVAGAGHSRARMWQKPAPSHFAAVRLGNRTICGDGDAGIERDLMSVDGERE